MLPAYLQGNDEMITSFTGDFEFLSNSYYAPIPYQGIVYPTNEHAYQAAKSLDIGVRKKISHLETPEEAKKKGNHIMVRRDWHLMSIPTFKQICFIKFNTHLDIQELLLDTGNIYLEDNEATYLGLVLMELRGKFKSQFVGRR